MGVLVPEIAGRFYDASDAAERLLLLLRVCVCDVTRRRREKDTEPRGGGEGSKM